MKKQFIQVMILGVLFFGCATYEDDPYCKKYTLISFTKLRQSVTIEEPREIKTAGKIYIYNTLLLINEPNVGIHIIDNRDKINPIPKAFIRLYGNVDIAVKDGFLYADSFMDLVVLDIQDVENIKVVNRVNDTFSYDKYQIMNIEDQYRCDFNTSNRVIIGEKQSITSPKP